MADLPRPAAREYAATSAQEHFAEMASMAWRIVAPPDLGCVDGTPMARLHDAEARVPGTAGFVVWYLRHLSREDVEHHDEVARAAAMLAPYRTSFDAVSHAIDQRRLPGGDVRPRERATIRSYLKDWRAELHTSERRFERIGSYLFVPSLLVLGLWETMRV